MGPKVVAYLERLEQLLRADGLARPLLVMQASGGLTTVGDAARRPIVTLDSGPTGGVLGCQHLGRILGEDNVICTDVGGTSFDVGLVLDGAVPLDSEPVVAQYTLKLPKLLVHSIGSGGGSIGWIDEGGLLRVGPQSAGASPGPACYGRGGIEATVTDADLVLGYLDADSFLGGRMRLDRDLALAALARLGASLGLDAEEVAVGVFRIINSQMADLIRKSTIEQGHDPRELRARRVRRRRPDARGLLRPRDRRQGDPRAPRLDRVLGRGDADVRRHAHGGDVPADGDAVHGRRRARDRRALRGARGADPAASSTTRAPTAARSRSPARWGCASGAR